MEFYTILTDVGKNMITSAGEAGTVINLTEMAVGDGNGNYHTPNPAQTALVNERWRSAINELAPDAKNSHWLIAELVIPVSVGNFTIREAGVFDDKGNLIAVGKYPATYKPTEESGTAKDLYIKMVLDVADTASVNLQIDPSIVLAPREYVDTKMKGHSDRADLHFTIDERNKLAGVLNVPTRHAVLSWGGGLSAEATEVVGHDAKTYTGNGTFQDIDLGMDFSTSEHGGMVMMKKFDQANNWLMQNSLSEDIASYLVLNDTQAQGVTNGMISEYSATGITIGDNGNINEAGSNQGMFAWNTTNKWRKTYKNVKSVVFDIANNWGSTQYLSIRSIEFYKNGILINMPASAFTAYATTIQPGEYQPWRAFDTTLSKTGPWGNTSWIGNTNWTTNQRLGIVFNTAIDFDEIVINNCHSEGNSTTNGAKDTKITVSPDEVTSTVYNEAIPNGELIFDGQIAQHPAADTVDDQSYVLVEWAFNPATGFAMCKYRGTGKNVAIEHPMGKKLLMGWYKRLLTADNWVVYSDKLPHSSVLILNAVNAGASSSSFHAKPTNKYLYLTGGSTANVAGDFHFFCGWFGDNLDQITPGMSGIEGSSASLVVADYGEVETGVEDIQMVFLKDITTANDWFAYSVNDGFGSILRFNTTDARQSVRHISVDGSKVTLTRDAVLFSGGNKYLLMVFGKKGNLPKGKSIQIKATEKKPFVAAIDKGWSEVYGAKDAVAGFKADTVFPMTDVPDGKHTIYLNEDGSVVYGSGDLQIADVQITDGLIVDLDVMPEGDEYETAWFPVTVNTKYILPNRFKTIKVEFDIYWNNTPSDENKRWVTEQFFCEGTIRGTMGGYKRINSSELIVSIGSNPYYNYTPGDDMRSVGGYYKLKVKRGY